MVREQIASTSKTNGVYTMPLKNIDSDEGYSTYNK